MNEFFKKHRKGILLSGVLLFPTLLYVFFATGNHNFNRLPYYGPATESELERNGKTKKEMIYHSTGPFSFTGQNGEELTEQFFTGRIYLVSFFNPNCGEHCAFINTRLFEVQKKFAAYDSVHIVSFYVPEAEQTEPDLAAYAGKIHARPGKWFLARTNKNILHKYASQSLLLEEMKDSAAFSHKARLVLVDKQGHIRGYYTPVKTEEPGKMTDDIKILITEYIHPDRSRVKQKKKSTNNE